MQWFLQHEIGGLLDSIPAWLPMLVALALWYFLARARSNIRNMETRIRRAEIAIDNRAKDLQEKVAGLQGRLTAIESPGRPDQG
jgi:hypothetical protein